MFDKLVARCKQCSDEETLGKATSLDGTETETWVCWGLDSICGGLQALH